ncbi:MAG: PHP domain-containing protein [Betaproteobacteria bacterium]|nr:PHP domain-containing protein [Betaproteobacteria bacterium]
MENFDLHNHSHASDGLLSPGNLVRLAVRNRCDALALTDHDTIDGIEEATATAQTEGLRFIAGVEISVSWAANENTRTKTIHVVGLGIDTQSTTLLTGLETVSNGRLQRAKAISEDFSRLGIQGLFEEAYALAQNKTMISRTHFARALVQRGHVPNINKAFERYLTEGKPGYQPHRWAALDDAIRWIRAAGGVAVLAHPGRYALDHATMDQLLSEFKSHGGEAIEVVTGSHNPREYREYATWAEKFGFLASRGADYHGDASNQWEPGTLPPLPTSLTPVWTALK